MNMKDAKKCLGILLAGSLATGMIQTAMAAITLQDGVPWVYNIRGDWAVLLHGPGCGDVVIPPRLDGYPVRWIGEGIFSGCQGLTSVTIPTNVTRIVKSAFYGCSGLTEISLPGGLTCIEEWVFAYCSELKGITIPDNVSAIEDSAFYACRSLETVDIPDSLRNIGDAAFCGCRELTNVILPNRVVNIGNSAFSCCDSLTNVSIGTGVTNIGEHAFYNCPNLKTMHVPEWWKSAFVDDTFWSEYAAVPPECEIVYYKAEKPAPAMFLDPEPTP